MTWKNSLITKLEIKKNRTLNLSLSNNQLTEIKGSEYVIGTGYRIKDLEFRFRSGGRSKKISSDLDLKLDLNIRNNETVIRKIVENDEQTTMGQQTISIKFSADYVVNSRLNLKMFYYFSKFYHEYRIQFKIYFSWIILITDVKVYFCKKFRK